MSKLTAARRNALPDSTFAGPNRSYPIPDRSHAANAKARATQQENKGNLSHEQAERIRAKANRKLNDAHGKIANHHLALHAHHATLAELHKGDAADLHRGMAAHHLGLAEAHNDVHEHFKAMADAEGEPPSKERAEHQRTSDAIHRAVKAGGPRPPKKRPFGSLSGAGHEMGVMPDVDTTGTGTNAGA